MDSNVLKNPGRLPGGVIKLYLNLPELLSYKNPLWHPVRGGVTSPINS